MNKFFRNSFFAAALCGAAVLSSCSDDPSLPDNAVNFESTTLGFTNAESELTINIPFARAAESDGVVTVGLSGTGVTYGTEFTTDPAATNNGAVVLNVAAGATSASFKVKKSDASSFEGDEKINFQITYVNGGLSIGDKRALVLSFGEIVAVSATVDVNGGGATYPNRVFIDFSANRQTAVARTSWDLAFSSKAGEFRVLLNSANGMLVRATNKTDLGSVTTADTVGFGGQLSLGAIFGVATSVEDPADLPAWILETTTWMDDPKGDITKTAIASISATDSENKVYIVNRGTGVSNAALGWKKVRVTRDGDGYSLQYADINSSTITTVKVAKNADTDLTYASMTSNSTVGVEPAAADWDIAWTGFTNTTNFGPGTPSFPYYFQDVVIQNTSGVATAQVLTATVSYDAFAEANLTGITFVDNNQINIGSSWRSTGPPPGPVGQKTDRFYLVKDAEGNIYKLMFTALTSDGERGKPSFKFDLVKKGS